MVRISSESEIVRKVGMGSRLTGLLLPREACAARLYHHAMSPFPRSTPDGFPAELSGLDDEVVHPVQPYQAVKTYQCPGCETPIEPGVGHVVVVPQESPDLRRHWHRGCWFKERRRLGYHKEQ